MTTERNGTKCCDPIPGARESGGPCCAQAANRQAGDAPCCDRSAKAGACCGQSTTAEREPITLVARDGLGCCERGVATRALPLRAPFGESEAERVAAAFKALADPTRVQIVALALEAGELCVCHIAEAFPLSQPTISHHLGVLRRAGVLRSTQRGVWAYYSVMEAWREWLLGASRFSLRLVAAAA